MVVNNIISKLIDIGFSEYESRAYTSLLQKNPATAYEIARMSGIPSSKIYEITSRLMEKGIIAVMDFSGKTKYIPMDARELISNQKQKIESICEELESDFNKLDDTTPEVSYIWNIHDYDFFINKAEQLIGSSQNSILVSTWNQEISMLYNALSEKENQNIKISVIHFGEIKYNIGHTFHHPIEDTIYEEKGGRGFVLVTDSKTALMGTVFSDNLFEGAWSTNAGFVTLAEDYIKHDIYIMKIVKRFDKQLIKKFGANYSKLRDVFNDEEEK